MGFRCESHSGSALFYKADKSNSLQDKSIYMRDVTTFQVKVCFFCLFKQKKKKKIGRGIGLADNSKHSDLKQL